MNSKKKTVVVAMSGGVDSSLTAVLLKDSGYNVVGITMRLWDEEDPDRAAFSDNPCCSIELADGARAVCDQIGVPHYVVDFREVFREEVIDDFYRQYRMGMTPNPCVRCNTLIKWQPLVKKKEMLGADYIATGHYARCIYNETDDIYELHRGKDLSKDQTYFLWGLNGEQLKNTLLPLGEYTKEKVRELAAKYDLPTAQRPESMEVCFIPDNNYRNFIRDRLEKEGIETSAGDILDTQGNLLGKHKGHHNYTIGQRKGLGIAIGRPAYVKSIIPEDNVIVIADDDELLSDRLSADSMNWINGVPKEEKFRAEVKIRYRDPGKEAFVIPDGDSKIRVEFIQPVRAVTPGQSVVIYAGDRVLGGGLIKN
ncbi:MAG: tRNA 2-thiouridine(34) synthase MnmA [bacterium]|nr:tRNA 2-thiouridine(34) synthase MnmA [bacterium]